MRQILTVALMIISTSVYADYFGCDLSVNDLSAGEEAPYRGREVRVNLGDYTCEAVIDQNIIVSTTVTSLLSGSFAQADGRASAAVHFGPFNPSTNSIDVVICECGLR